MNQVTLLKVDEQFTPGTTPRFKPGYTAFDIHFKKAAAKSS
jgi:hypothetical protein